MTRGSITKVVSSFGSRWGRIRPAGASREVFFNADSLEKPADFSSIEVGQDVEFDECADFVTGTHAEHVVVAASLAVGKPVHP